MANNRESYNRIATQWEAARGSFFGKEREYLDLLLQGLPLPALILDLGCGNGRPMAEYVTAQGYTVLGVDQSEAQLATAKARLPEVWWVQARLEDLPFRGNFAGIICWDSLFHIERTHHGNILAYAANSLLPGGKMMLTVGGSAHPPFTDTMFGEEFFYDSYPPEAAVALVKEAGLKLLVGEFMNYPTGGRDKGRYAIVAEK